MAAPSRATGPDGPATHDVPSKIHVSPRARASPPPNITIRWRSSSYAIAAPTISSGPGRAIAVHASASSVHVLEQPSLERNPPSSHCSWKSSTPLPQRSFERQSALQPSPSSVLPSSHISPGSTSPLPQPGVVHTPRKHTPVSSEVVHESPSTRSRQAATCSAVAHIWLATQTLPAGHNKSPHG